MVFLNLFILVKNQKFKQKEKITFRRGNLDLLKFNFKDLSPSKFILTIILPILTKTTDIKVIFLNYKLKNGGYPPKR